MVATDILRSEHDLVWTVLRGLEPGAKPARELLVSHPRCLRPLVAFLADFVEDCHHVKEDTYLLPKLATCGFVGCGSHLTTLLHERRAGRALTEVLTGAAAAVEHGDERALDLAAGALCAQGALLRAGISDEEELLFPLAERVLTPEDSSELEQAFAQIDSARAGGLWEGFYDLVGELNGGWPDERPETLTAALPPPSATHPTSPRLSSSFPGIPRPAPSRTLSPRPLGCMPSVPSSRWSAR